MTGKEKCEYLKQLRETIANKYGFQEFHDDPCKHTYCPTGYCEMCDQKKTNLLCLLRDLNVNLIELQDICNSVPIPSEDEDSEWLKHQEKRTEADWKNETRLNNLQWKRLHTPKQFYTSSLNGYMDAERLREIEKRDLESAKNRPEFICKLFTIGKLLGISRLRIDVDGPGVTTLVGLHSCPLNCAYCINHPAAACVHYTVRELYEEVKKDTLYYETTGGGICFGGHEPLLQQKFIKKFIKYTKRRGCKWKFGMETSLNGKLDTELLEMLDFIIVDVKTLNPEIYQKYTKGDNAIVLKNLQIIKDKIPNITIRIPHIPDYNDVEDINNSINYLMKLGYHAKQLDLFDYVPNPKLYWGW